MSMTWRAIPVYARPYPARALELLDEDAVVGGEHEGLREKVVPARLLVLPFLLQRLLPGTEQIRGPRKSSNAFRTLVS